MPFLNTNKLMNVTKRNGTQEEMKFDKVTKRISQKCSGLSETIDPQKLAMTVIEGLFDGVSTSQIDTQIAEVSASKVVDHPDYSQLAANVSISNLHKNTKTTFSTVMKDLYEYVNPKNGKHSPVVSKELMDVIKGNSAKINSYIDYNRDYNYDYFGYRTLEKSYLLKINGVVVERPQHMLMRVSLGIHGDDLKNAFKTYDMMSNKMFTHATPTLFNAGTPRPQMSSCFLIDMIDDSIDGIYDTLKTTAKISKDAGGIGLAIHKVRSTGSYIAGTNGTSNGIVPMLKVFNETARYVDQCFTENTNIITDNGIKKISDINRGDKVLTDDGLYYTVNETRIYEKESKEVLEISTHGLPTRVTDIHPLLGIKLGDNSTPKRELGRLLKELNKPDYFEAKDLKKGDYLGRVIPKIEKDVEKLSIDDFRFYGILLGDGSISKVKNECCIYLGTEEKGSTINFVKNYLEQNFIDFSKTIEGSVTKFYIYLPTNSRFKFNRNDLYNSIGEKRINHNYLNIGKQKSIALLKGLIETDGSVKDDRIMFYNSSKPLVDGLDYIVLRLELPLYITERNRIGEVSSYKNIQTKKHSYECEIPKTSEMSEIFGVTESAFFKHILFKGVLYTKISNIEYIPENTKVTTYDLCVDNNHTYTTQLSTNTNGGGKRKGSFAIYVEPWHSDILDFLELKKNHGKEEQRARDLFYAMWMNDLFMERVESDGIWSLMSPSESKGLDEVYGDDFKELYEKYENEGKFVGQIKARSLWEKITTSQIETGTPYMLYKDSANNKSNQKNLGTIKSSNLCITGDQRVVTNKGYLTAKELHDTNEELTLFNGDVEVKSSKMKLRGEQEDVYKITLENGMEHKVTSYHGIPVDKGRGKIERVECKDLVVGDKIPVQKNKGLFGKKDFVKEAYLLGVYQSDGTQNESSIMFDLWENDFDLVDIIETYIHDLYTKYNYKPRYSNKGGYFVDTNSGQSDVKKKRLTTSFFKTLDFKKGSVPSWIWESNEETMWSYLKGLLQTDGTVNLGNSLGNPLQLSYSDININFLKELQLIFNNLGLSTSIRLLRKGGKTSLPNGKGGYSLYDTKDCFRLIVSNKLDALKIEEKTEFLTRKGVILEDRKYRDNTKKSYKVESIEYVGKEDVFCPTVYNDENIFISQGMKTFNCAEIVEFTSPEEVAVCNLASIALPSFVKVDENGKPYFDHRELYKVSYQVTYNLNKVIDKNYYPVEEARVSNMKHRPIGLGIQGLADTFMMMRLPFTSDEAKKLNKELQETIYFASITASNDMAITDGHYETFKGSPMSKGIFQYEMWGLKDDDLSGRWDWEALRYSVVKHGVRNSLTTALMPTASTGQILGNVECFEPITSNMGTRRVLSGEFITINKHLIKDLIEMGLWDSEMKEFLMAKNGSVQELPIPSDLKELYKTAYEMSMKDIIDMSADRGAFVDQSQSLNLFMKGATSKKLRSMHFYAWKKGLKTGMYYLRTKAATTAKKFTLGVDIEDRLNKANEDFNKPNENGAMSADDFKAMVEKSRRASESENEDDGCLMCGS